MYFKYAVKLSTFQRNYYSQIQFSKWGRCILYHSLSMKPLPLALNKTAVRQQFTTSKYLITDRKWIFSIKSQLSLAKLGIKKREMATDIGWNLKYLEASNVENADEWSSLAFTAVERTVNSLNNPLEHSIVYGLAYCFYGIFHLHKHTLSCNFLLAVKQKRLVCG